MSKLDLKKEFKHLYNPSTKEFSLVDVPPMHFLMIDGSGDPNTAQSFKDAMEALYAVAYTIKFAVKKSGGEDFTVMPVEGLWWADDMDHFSMDAKDIWKWTVMIAQPDQVTEDIVKAAIAETDRKKNPAALPLLRFETFHEGLSAQFMHIGPYADEAPTIAHMHSWIIEQGYNYHGAGKHHEIYLSDPRRVAPEKMRTVVRQPVLKK
jgi:hypothetical protein